MAVLVAASLVAGCGAVQDAQTARENDRIESARGVGETLDFGDIAARWPLEWKGNDVVVFLTWVGTATLDLRNGTVTHHKDESLMSPNPLPQPTFDVLPSDGRYGPWESRGDPRRLRVGDANSCAQFLISPDGRHVACKWIVNDWLRETNRSSAVVIRIR
jgi:hypothetical protein